MMDIGGLHGRGFFEFEKKMEPEFMSSAIVEQHSSGHGLARPSWTIIPILYHVPPAYDEAGTFHLASSEEKLKYTMQDQYGSSWQINADELVQHKEATRAALKLASNGLSAMKSLRYSHAVNRFDTALNQLWRCHRNTLLELWIKVHQGHALLRAGLLQCPAIHGQDTRALLERSEKTFWFCQAILGSEVNPHKQHITPHPFKRSLLFSSLLGLAWCYFFRGDPVKAKERILQASVVDVHRSHWRADRDIDTCFLRIALERVIGNLGGIEKWLNRLSYKLSDYDEDVFLVKMLGQEYNDITSKLDSSVDYAFDSAFRPEMKFFDYPPCEPSVKKLLEQLEAGYLGNMWLDAGARKEAKVAYKIASTSQSLLRAAAIVGLGNVMMRDRAVKPEASSTGNESELEYAAAERQFNEALQIYDTLGYKEGQIIVQCNLGHLYHKRGQVENGLERYQSAMTYFTKEMETTLAALHLHLKLAGLYLDKGNLVEAFKFIQAAAKIPTTSYLVGEAWVEHLYGTYYLKRAGVAKSNGEQSSNLSEAQNHLRKAVKCFSQIQRNLRNFWTSLSITIFEQQKDTYTLLLWCLACQRTASAIEALVWCERSRSRTSVVDGRDSFSQILHEYLSDEEAILEAFVATVSENIDKLTWEENWKNLQLLLRRCRLSAGSTVVEYVLCADSGYLIFVLDVPGGQPKMKKISFAEQKLNGKNLDKEKLKKLVNDTTCMISRSNSKPGRNGELETNLALLYNLLIEPVEHWLQKSKHVVVIPHEVLFKVPFHALMDNKKTFLIEKFTLSCAESIRNLVHCWFLWETGTYSRQREEGHNSSRWLLVGINEHKPVARDLKMAEDEAAEIASMKFGSGVTKQRFLGSEATKDRIMARLEYADIIHLATHGIISTQYERGGILFAAPDDLQDIDGAADIVDVERGNAATTESAEIMTRSLDDFRFRWTDNVRSAEKLVLSANEISRMKLKAQLVVLSACQSAVGVILGDGVVGLGRALLMSGVPCTVLSLWPVSDSTTVDFMKRFYTELARGLSVADAMKIVMVAMLKAEKAFSKEAKYTVQHWAAFWTFGLPIVRLHGQELPSAPPPAPWPHSQLSDKVPYPLRPTLSMVVGAVMTLAVGVVIASTAVFFRPNSET